jgi:hypothetical protein
MGTPNIAQPYEAEDAEPTAVFGSYGDGPTSSSVPASVARLRSSYSDDDLVGQTGVSDVIADLARLSDPTCIPRLNRPLSRSEVLSPPEAFVASLVDANLNMQSILDMSPLPEDDTLRFLARLIERGLVSLLPHAPVLPVMRASCPSAPSYPVNTDELWD